MIPLADLLAPIERLASRTTPRGDPLASDRLVVKSSGQVIFLSVREISWVEAQGDYVKFHAGERSCLVRTRIKEVAVRLDPRKFLQIHRSTIVNIDRIARIGPRDGQRLGVVLRDGTGLVVSHGYRQRVKDFYAAGLGANSAAAKTLRSTLTPSFGPLPKDHSAVPRFFR